MARLLALLILALAMLIAGCGGSDDEAGETTTATQSTQKATGPQGGNDRPGTGEKTGAGQKKDGADANGTGRGGGGTGSGGGAPSDGGRSSDRLPLPDLSAEATPADPEVIARMIPRAQITPEGRVQTMAPDPARHEVAQKNMYGSVRDFGQETEGEQATQVTFALVDYLNALTRSDWQRACERLYSQLRERFEQGAEGKQIDCAESFGAMLGRRSVAAHRRAMLLDVSSVRIGQDDEGRTRAFVIYKTPETLSADMPLYLEDGAWKVAALEAYALRPEQVG